MADDTIGPDFDVHRRKLLASLGAAGVAGIAGCADQSGSGDGGDSPTSTQPQDQGDTSTPPPKDQVKMGGELIATFGADVKNFDPTQINDTTSSKAFALVYESVMATDFNGKPQPYLAESVEITGDTSLKITLREGVMFHDPVGREMTAEDVKASWERYKETPRESDVYNWYDSSTVQGDYELDVTLSRKYAPIKFSLGTVPIVPKEVVDGDVDLTEDPVGTGPYVYDKREADSFFRIKRFEDHWFEGTDQMPEKPPIETVTFRVITEQSAQAAALEAGDVDMIGGPPAGKIEQYKNSDKFSVGERIAGGFDMFVYPMHPEADTPFQNRKVRLGVNRLIPREAIVKNVYDGIGIPAYAPISPLAQQFTSQEFQNEMRDEYAGYDTEEAASLLEEGFEEAGFEKPFSTKIITNNNPQREQWCQLIQESMNQSGFFDVKLETFEFNTYVGKILAEDSYKQNFIVAVGWSAGWDPDNYVHNLFHKENFTPACCNINHYDNPEVTSMIDEGLQTYDIEERKSIYEELQRTLVKESPMAYIRFGKRQDVWATDTLKGFSTYPIDSGEYNSLYAPYSNKFAYVDK
jgi:peptide/nickel transport system substrate-binding protein